MESNVNLKGLWNQQQIPETNYHDLQQKIMTYKKSKTKSIWLLNSLLLTTICIIIGIWVYFKPEYISTKIGTILTILAISMVILFNSKKQHRFNTESTELSNVDYLTYLYQEKTKQTYIQTKVMSLYFMLLSIGISLYMFEYTLKMPLIGKILAYFFLAIWIGLNWFVFRPRVIKKNNLKIDHLISQLEKLQSQIKE